MIDLKVFVMNTFNTKPNGRHPLYFIIEFLCTDWTRVCGNIDFYHVNMVKIEGHTDRSGSESSVFEFEGAKLEKWLKLSFFYGSVVPKTNICGIYVPSSYEFYCRCCNSHFSQEWILWPTEIIKFYLQYLGRE